MAHRIVVVGAGGVGAETLKLLFKTDSQARIRVIDRDFVDEDTLKRQNLYTKKDLGKLKTNAVQEKLGFDGICEHLDFSNAERLLQDAKVVLDCTDNWQTRCVINAWALKLGKPWIYTAAIRNETMCATLTPNSACFVCFNEKSASPKSCRIEGITREATFIAGQTQVDELSHLLNGVPRLEGKLQYTDTKTRTCLTLQLRKTPDCKACVKKTFRIPKTKAVVLCGEREYLFRLKGRFSGKKLSSFQPARFGDVLKIKWKKGEIVLFPTGRVLVRNLPKTEAERAFCALLQKIGA